MKIQIIWKVLLVILSIIIIGFSQKTFKKMTAWDTDNYVDIPIVSSKTLLINNLFNIWNEWFYVSILEHTLPLKIINSINIWKNEWLKQEKTIDYIDEFMKLYWYRWNIYSVVFWEIISETTVNEEVKTIYKNLMYEWLAREDSIVNWQWLYFDIYNKLEPLLCKDLELPINSKITNMYRDAWFYYYKEKDFLTAWCYVLHSWYKNNMDMWKTLLMNSYTNYFINNTNDEDFIKNYNTYMTNLWNLSIQLKNIILW